jgi:hypothetical protein
MLKLLFRILLLMPFWAGWFSIPHTALAAAPVILLTTSSLLMNTSIDIGVTGSGFGADTPGIVWFDANGNSVADTGEPQEAVVTNSVGEISGINLITPSLEPARTYRVRADIPEDGTNEASASFQTSSVTTSLSVSKYDAHDNLTGTTTRTYQWLAENLPVQGDGKTQYYCEGPYFDTSDFDTLWDTPETGNNIDSRYFGKPEGTDIKDICNLVGGASPGDTITIKASDNMSRVFDYESIYNPPPELGKVVACWYNADIDGKGAAGFVPDYADGMRLLFFAQNPNPDGKLVFGNWDMHQTLPWSRWYFYNGQNPSSGGQSVKYIYNVEIHEPHLIACDSDGNPQQSFAPGETAYVKGLGLDFNSDYKIWIQAEPVTYAEYNNLDIPNTTKRYQLSQDDDPSAGQESVTTDSAGNFAPLVVWNISASAVPNTQWDIVADNQNAGTIGVFDSADAIDNPGFEGFRLENGSSPALPAITSFNPVSAKKGKTVNIYGTNFTGTTGVYFKNTPAASFEVISSSQISAVVGSGSSGPVKVVTPEGTATKSGFTYISSHSGGGSGGSGGSRSLTPVISSFSPLSAGEGDTVLIQGNYLSDVSEVSFGGILATSFVVNSSSRITAVVGSGSSGAVQVVTPNGRASLSGFTFIARANTNIIMSLNPDNLTLSPGAIFDLAVSIDTGDVASRGSNLGLRFDADKLKCIGVDEGTFYSNWAHSHNCSTLIFPDPGLNNSTGEVTSFGIAIVGQTEGGPAGSGTLCVFHLEALDVTSNLSDVVITDVKVADSQGIVINQLTVHNALITIISDTASSLTPEPSVTSIPEPSPVPIASPLNSPLPTAPASPDPSLANPGTSNYTNLTSSDVITHKASLNWILIVWIAVISLLIIPLVILWFSRRKK